MSQSSSPDLAPGASGGLSAADLRRLKKDPKRYLAWLSDQNRQRSAALSARQLDPTEQWRQQREQAWVQSNHTASQAAAAATAAAALMATAAESVKRRSQTSSDSMQSCLFPQHPDVLARDHAAAAKAAAAAAAATAATPATGAAAVTAASPSPASPASAHIRIHHRERREMADDAMLQLSDDDDEAASDSDDDGERGETVTPLSPASAAANAARSGSSKRKSWAPPTAAQLAEMRALMEEQYRLTQLEAQLDAGLTGGRRITFHSVVKSPAAIEESKDSGAQQGTRLAMPTLDLSAPSGNATVAPLSLFSSTALSSALEASLTHRSSAPDADDPSDSEADPDGDAGRDRGMGARGATGRRRKTWQRNQIWLATEDGEAVAVAPLHPSNSIQALFKPVADAQRVINSFNAAAATPAPAPVPSSLPSLPSLPPLPPVPSLPHLPSLPSLPQAPPSPDAPKRSSDAGFTAASSSSFTPSGALTSRQSTAFDAEPSFLRSLPVDASAISADSWSDDDPLANEHKRDVGDGRDSAKRYAYVRDGDIVRYSLFFSTGKEMQEAQQAREREMAEAFHRATAMQPPQQPHTSRSHSERPLKRWERPLWAADLPVRGRSDAPSRPPSLPPSVPSTPRGAATALDEDVLPLPAGFETPRLRGDNQQQVQQSVQPEPQSKPSAGAPTDQCVLQ